MRAVFTFLIWMALMGTHAFASSEIESIEIADDVPAEQITRLQTDLDYLKTLNFNHPDAELLKLMEISDANPTTLLDWMGERVHYLVNEDLDFKSSIGIARNHYSYENPGVLPVFETPTQQPDDSSLPASPGSALKVMTVMQNITTAFYYAGKQTGQLASITIPGIGKVPVTSPRIGVLKIGKGLFAKHFKDDGIKPDMKPYIAMRLSTLFHEARHSDGNGKSLGFLHAVCPSGTYKGYAGCDRNLNGPYQIEAKFLNSFITACTDCSEGDKRAIATLAADADSRQIKFTPDPNNTQNAKIQVLKSQIEMCKLFTQLNVAIPANLNCNMASLQKEMADLEAAAQVVTGTPSTEWDATPEGI